MSSIVPGQSDQSCLGVGWILHLGFVTRPKRSTYTDGPRHYCHVLAQYCLLQRFFSQLERKVFPLRSWRSLSNNGFDPSRSRDHREREISSVAPLHTGRSGTRVEKTNNPNKTVQNSPQMALVGSLEMIWQWPAVTCLHKTFHRTLCPGTLGGGLRRFP